VRTLKGHTDEVKCVAFSPDGTRIVSGSGDNLAKIWNAATGFEVSSFVGVDEGGGRGISPGVSCFVLEVV